MPVFKRTSWTSWRCSLPFTLVSTFTPSTSIVPNEGSSRKLMQRSKVLLPDPLRPMIQTTSRGATSTEICFSTCKRPKYFSRLEILTMGAISAVSSGKACLDNPLNIRQNDGHHPIKYGSDDEGL